MLNLNWRLLQAKLKVSLNKNRRKVTGFNVDIPLRSRNFTLLADGMVLWVKNSKQQSINTNFIIMKRISHIRFFLCLPLYYIGGYNYTILGFTFGRKVKCSRLTIRKLKKTNSI